MLATLGAALERGRNLALLPSSCALRSRICLRTCQWPPVHGLAYRLLDDRPAVRPSRPSGPASPYLDRPCRPWALLTSFSIFIASTTSTPCSASTSSPRLNQHVDHPPRHHRLEFDAAAQLARRALARIARRAASTSVDTRMRRRARRRPAPRRRAPRRNRMSDCPISTENERGPTRRTSSSKRSSPSLIGEGVRAELFDFEFVLGPVERRQVAHLRLYASASNAAACRGGRASSTPIRRALRRSRRARLAAAVPLVILLRGAPPPPPGIAASVAPSDLRRGGELLRMVLLVDEVGVEVARQEARMVHRSSDGIRGWW